jgi:hypothetical protein
MPPRPLTALNGPRHLRAVVASEFANPAVSASLKFRFWLPSWRFRLVGNSVGRCLGHPASMAHASERDFKAAGNGSHTCPVLKAPAGTIRELSTGGPAHRRAGRGSDDGSRPCGMALPRRPCRAALFARACSGHLPSTKPAHRAERVSRRSRLRRLVVDTMVCLIVRCAGCLPGQGGSPAAARLSSGRALSRDGLTLRPEEGQMHRYLRTRGFSLGRHIGPVRKPRGQGAQLVTASTGEGIGPPRCSGPTP